jgi:hypothetical protein
MSRVDPPLAGVLRVVYFLCISFVSLFVVVTGVFGFYHDPNESITDLSSALDFGSASFDDVFIPADADHFVEQAEQGNVFSVVVIGDQVRYELYSGSSQYEASLPPGETFQDLLDEAGVGPFEIPFVDDSLAGEAFSGNTDDGDYERNIMIILAVIASALFAAAVLGLGGRFNPLRAGLLGGGLVVFLTAMAFWGAASNDWLGLPVSLVAFVVLAAVFPFLEDGLPMEERRQPPSAGAISFTPGPSADPPAPPPPPPPPPPPLE